MRPGPLIRGWGLNLSATFAQTTTAISVHALGDSPVFGESTITVSIDDEGGGPFISLSQPSGGKIDMDYEQLLQVADAARMLMEGLIVETKTVDSGGA